MTTQVFVTIKGQTQGEIKGEATNPKFKDKFKATFATHTMTNSSDIHSGAAGGQKIYRPFIIETVTPSPLLVQAYNSKEPLEVKIEFTSVDDNNGELKPFYTAKLKGAKVETLIHSIQNTPPHNFTSRIELSYQEINWSNGSQEASTELHNERVISATPSSTAPAA